MSKLDIRTILLEYGHACSKDDYMSQEGQNAYLKAEGGVRELFKALTLELIGENDISGGNPGHTFREQHRNELRAELRKKIEAL